MRNLILILAIFFSYNLINGQDIIQTSGRVKLIGNPCLDETCLPGIVWSLETDTASYILTENHDWIWGDNPLIIYGIEHFENDSINIYGQFSIKQEWDGEKFYELEVLNKEQRDTIIVKNSTLTLEFVFEIFECGINVFKHPENQSISQLDYNIGLDTAIYTYKPKLDFVGIDTVVFLTDCGSTPDNMYFEIIEYLIQVTDFTKINNFMNDNNFQIFPNPSTGFINIMSNNHKGLDFRIYNSIGQTINQGKLKQDLQLDLKQGIYILTILDKYQLVYRQKIVINE